MRRGQGKLVMSDAGRRLRERLLSLLAAVSVSGCTGMTGSTVAVPDGADYWDSAILYNQHLDVANLPGASWGDGPMLSGFVSAVAANGNALFFIDQGAGLLVQLDLVTMATRSLARLQSPAVTGLSADLDGRLYVINRAQRTLLVFDTSFLSSQSLPLGPLLANPLDVAVAGNGQWLLVLDGLDGRIATFDTLGAISQLLEPVPTPSVAILAPRAIAVSGDKVLVLDAGTDQVISLDLQGALTGIFAEDDLQMAMAMTADRCGRFFVADANKGTLYLGFADMSLPGRRIDVPELANSEVSDLWTDGSVLYAATRSDGIHVLLIDPGCGFQ